MGFATQGAALVALLALLAAADRQARTLSVRIVATAVIVALPGPAP